jgi:hypothetical protein
MTVNHGGLLTCCVVILSAIVTNVSASGAREAQSSVAQHRHHGAQVPRRHSLYNFYTAPAVPRPDCYLPSDACPSEYSIQN